MLAKVIYMLDLCIRPNAIRMSVYRINMELLFIVLPLSTSIGWNFKKNPLNLNSSYIDYHNMEEWSCIYPDRYDIWIIGLVYRLVGWLGLGMGYVVDSFYNTIYYN